MARSARLGVLAGLCGKPRSGSNVTTCRGSGSAGGASAGVGIGGANAGRTLASGNSRMIACGTAAFGFCGTASFAAVAGAVVSRLGRTSGMNPSAAALISGQRS